MPNKKCPACKVETHVRTSTCVCGYVFYVPKKKAIEVPTEVVEEVKKEVEVVKEEPTVVISTVKKVVKDPEAFMKEQAETFGYSVKEIDKKAETLSKKFKLTKMIGTQKYYGVLHDATGKITGVSAFDI